MRRGIVGKFNFLVDTNVSVIPDKFVIQANDIRTISEIGEGSSARVYKGTYNDNNVALKVFKLNSRIPAYQELLRKEALALMNFNHDNIIKFWGICCPEMTIVLEYCEKILKLGDSVVVPCNTLRQLIDTLRCSFPFDLKLEAVYQVASGLQYLHSKEVLHCDLKSHNILVKGKEEGEFIFKLADIGVAHDTLVTTSVLSSRKHQFGTLHFQSPELLNGYPHTKTTDIYSFGMVMYELAEVEIPHPWFKEFQGKTNEIARRVIKGERPNVNKEVDGQYRAMMEWCWIHDPSARPVVENILKFVNEIDEAKTAGPYSPTLASPRKKLMASTQSKDLPKYRLYYDPSVQTAKSDDLSTRTPVLQDITFREPDAPVVQKNIGIDINLPEPDAPMVQDVDLLEPDAPLAQKDIDISSPEPDTPPMAQRDVDINNPELDDQVVQEDLPEPDEELLMRWHGYSNKYFKIDKLRNFQVACLNALHHDKDVLVVQSTSAGKSVCFQLPAAMTKENEMVILVVPTVSLATDQANYLSGLGIKVTILGSLGKKSDYCDLFEEHNVPSMLIVTPETLMGGNTFRGVKDKLLDGNKSGDFVVKLIAIDECHLIWDWGGNFRDAYNRLRELKDVFDVPIVALTATLTLDYRKKLKEHILRSPVELIGSIDRSNVKVCLAKYKAPAGKKGSWLSVAKQIHELIGDEKAIVYCSFASNSDSLCLAFLEIGLTASAYAGGSKTVSEKQEIQQNVESGKIQVLVATQAFGLGVNIKWIRYVVHCGTPPNLALWVQELGRAGRDGLPATAYLLFNEYADQQRLKFWTANCQTEEKDDKKADFVQLWRYIYAALSGYCLRRLALAHFGEVSSGEIKENCCSGCDIIKEIEMMDVQDDVISIIGAMQDISSLGLKCTSQTKLVDFLLGKQKQGVDWNRTPDISFKEVGDCSYFGKLKNRSENFIKCLIYQMIGKGWIDPVYLETTIQGKYPMVLRYFELMEEKWRALDRTRDNQFLFPNPNAVWDRFYGISKSTSSSGSQKSKSPAGKNMLSVIIEMLEAGNWVALERKEQFEFLGLEDSKQLLYAEDVYSVPGCPLVKNKDGFLYTDLVYSKGSAYPKKNVTISLQGKDTTLTIMRNDCRGVKKCGNEQCLYATSTRSRENGCLHHENEPLISTGSCPGTFVYIEPGDKSDRRRWLGFIDRATKCAGEHDHPTPTITKPGSRAEEIIAEGVQKDPSRKPSEMAKGYGLPCIPAALSPACAKRSVLVHLRHKYKASSYSSNATSILENFDKVIKGPIDDQDMKYLEEDRKELIQKYTTPYLRYWNISSQDDAIAVFMSPQMTRELSLMTFIEADVTYPGCKLFKYLLNVVGFSPLLMHWQVVGRVMMSRVSAKMYKTAFKLLLEYATDDHPEFKNGENFRAWIVDFSDAQASGIEENIAAGAHLRGCHVHFLRAVMKIADKVCSSQAEKDVFLKIAKHIPNCNTSDISVLFRALCGDVNLTEIREDTLQLTSDEMNVKTDTWLHAKKWSDWWLRPRHVKMICATVSDISKSDWNLCPRTTNAVESHNKISCETATRSLSQQFTHMYRTDREAAYQAMAAESGIKVGTSKKSVKAHNKSKQRWRSSRVSAKNANMELESIAVVGIEQNYPTDHEPLPSTSNMEPVPSTSNMEPVPSTSNMEPVPSTSNMEPRSRRASRKTAKQPTPTYAEGSAPQATTSTLASPIESMKRMQDGATSGVSKKMRSTCTVDPLNIGRKILINTQGKRGKQYGWLPATVTSIEDGKYKAVYDETPSFSVFLDSIFDDPDVQVVV